MQSCSIGARGLWHELIGVMHECVPYGHLTVNSAPMDDAKAARLCGVDLREYRKLLAELDGAGVPGRTDGGVMYSRRMVRDEATRNARASGGPQGAGFGVLGAEHGSKGGRPRKETGDKKPPLYPPPSSAVAFASSASSENRDVGGSSPSVATSPRPNGNGAVENSVRQRRNTAPGMQWDNKVWVAHTAETVETPRRVNEGDEDWKDRVFTAIERRMKTAGADWNRRLEAKRTA